METLEAALRPLRYAAKSPKNASVVKGLESALRQASRLAPGPAIASAVSALASGLDAASPGERHRRLVEALELLQDQGEVEALSARSNAEPKPKVQPGRKPKGPSGTSNDDGPQPPKNRAKAMRAALPPAPAEGPPPGTRTPMARARLGTALAQVVGVGPKTAEKLAKKGLRTVQDLLFFVPKGYEDRGTMRSIASLAPGERATVEGEVLHGQSRMAGRGRRIYEVVIGDGTGRLNLRFFRFRRQMMEDKFSVGTRVRVSGKVSKFGAQCQMVHPESDPLGGRSDEGPVPVYPDVEGVPARSLRSIVQRVAAACGGQLQDPMLPEILLRRDLVPLDEAVARVHHPDSLENDNLEKMRNRLVFDELLYFQLALGIQRTRREAEPGLVHGAVAGWEERAQDLFPFAFTGAQRRACAQIVEDLSAPRPMNRLLLGDVGSGKTAVAMLAAALVRDGGRQVAILAPTEVLAEQHARNARRDLEANGLRVAILTGSTPRKSRQALLRWMKTGHVDVVIGTHALLEPDVQFKDLGLVVIDEQHRFGVEQRSRLRRQRDDVQPDVLVMTATPIPRTLALTAYGDLQVSVIDELPPGRTPIETKLVEDGEPAYARIEEQVAQGRQAYIVFPLVETSEKLDLRAATAALEDLRARFPRFEVGLLHGRLGSDEKNEVMGRFAKNEIQVLVCTTVVEVGVDVPNATVMAIEDAHRFGLSQLHQLRGRVGRGRHPGHCFLIATEASDRLQVLEQTTSGFEVAERDLQLRGPGEMLGVRQSGLPDIVLADLVRDAHVVEWAREEADRLLARDPRLLEPALVPIRTELLRRFSHRLSLAEVG